jgi:hypothetical protein
MALDCIVDSAPFASVGAVSAQVDAFVAWQSRAGWSRPYFDDMNWMSLALVRAYKLLSNATHLAVAVSLFDNVMAAWDTTCCIRGEEGASTAAALDTAPQCATLALGSCLAAAAAAAAPPPAAPPPHFSSCCGCSCCLCCCCCSPFLFLPALLLLLVLSSSFS